MRTFFLFCLLLSSLSAEVIEIRKIEEFTKYAEEGTLLIFDIDNTIMEPAQTLGSDQWFNFRIDGYVDKGYPHQEAVECALAEWMAIQNITKVQLVEPQIEKIIDTFQKKGWPLIGMTNRGLGLATRTAEQLFSLNIDLNASSPIKGDHFFENEEGILFRRGILFTAGTDKGVAFFKLMDQAGYTPKRIVFVNDQTSDLWQVESLCKRRGIPFIGLRYGFLDRKVERLSKEVVDLQWEHFGKLLSDTETEKLLKH